jgi:hypothetical protein
MLPETLQNLFNPNANIKLSDYTKYRASLETYAAFGNTEQSENAQKAEGNFDPAFLDQALKYKQIYSDVAMETKNKLISAYFPSITENDIFENFDTLWEFLATKKPGLTSFFFLPRVKSLSQVSSSEVTSTEN